MVPIPEILLNRVIMWLQAGSVEASYVAFQLVGVPVFRTGSVLSLPGVTIEVAEACSGIRSSLVMLGVSLWPDTSSSGRPGRKFSCFLATLPRLIAKNAVRIVTLTLLSVYVDPQFLAGSLHHQGGVVFFLLALVPLVPILLVLQGSERTARRMRGDETRAATMRS